MLEFLDELNKPIIDVEHLTEEFVDVQILMKQFYFAFGLDPDTIKKYDFLKAERTLSRIEEGFYEE